MAIPIQTHISVARAPLPPNKFFLDKPDEVKEIFGVEDPLKVARAHGERIGAGSIKEIYKIKLNGKEWALKAYLPGDDIDPVLLELSARPILKRIFQGTNAFTPIAYGLEGSGKCPVLLSEFLTGFSAIGKGEIFDGIGTRDAASLELAFSAPVIHISNLDSFFIKRDHDGNNPTIGVIDLESLLYLGDLPDGPDSKLPILFIEESQKDNHDYPKIRSDFARAWLQRISEEPFRGEFEQEIQMQTGAWLGQTSSRLILGKVALASEQYYDRVRID